MARTGLIALGLVLALALALASPAWAGPRRLSSRSVRTLAGQRRASAPATKSWLDRTSETRASALGEPVTTTAPGATRDRNHADASPNVVLAGCRRGALRMTAQSPLFLKLDNHLLRVADLDSAISFYRDRLGHRLLWRSAEAAGFALPETDAELVVHLKIGPERRILSWPTSTSVLRCS